MQELRDLLASTQAVLFDHILLDTALEDKAADEVWAAHSFLRAAARNSKLL